jgi:hypothetical protein
LVAIGTAFDDSDVLAVLPEAGAELAIDYFVLKVLQAHFVQSTILAYDTTNGSGGGSGGDDGFGGGIETRLVGRGSRAKGAVPGVAGGEAER